MLTEQVIKAINESILCWLASVDKQGQPSCSPKEVFLAHDNKKLIIANIASPNSVANITANNKVCVSFINVLSQKGYKVKGNATYLTQDDESYQTFLPAVEQLTQGKFPISGLFIIEATQIKPIVAPSYFVFPEESEQEKINKARVQYNLH